MLAANQSYTDSLGNGLSFASHVAHYPVCWGYNIGIPGIVFEDLTGAPLLVQVGDLDDYDEGGAVCESLIDALPEPDRSSASVKVYPNAHHAWDRLVGDLENQISLRLDARLRFLRVGYVVELNLRGHDRRSRLAEESARHAHLPGRVRCRGNHRGLFHGHRHQHVVVVHTEIECDRERQAVHPDDVLAHSIGDLECEAPAILQV